MTRKPAQNTSLEVLSWHESWCHRKWCEIQREISSSSRFLWEIPSSVQHSNIICDWDTQGTLHKNVRFRSKSRIISEDLVPKLQAWGCNPKGLGGMRISA